MMFMARTLISIILCLGLVGCISTRSVSNLADSEENNYLNQVRASTQIAPELLKEELTILKKKLLVIHPDPFTRYSLQDFEQQIELIKSTINRPLTRAEFYLKIAPLLANLKDVHSYVHFPQDQLDDLLINQSAFPLAIIVQNNQAYVAADLSDENLIKNGAQILSINKTPLSFILTVMQTLIAEETESGQRLKIQMSFSQLLEAMGIAGRKFEIEYLWHGEILEAQLSGLELKDGFHSKLDSYYGFSKLNQDTALLWLNDFNEQPEIFNDYLDKQFAEMKQQKITNLILDIRFNSGGLTENLKNLLSRLIDEPTQWAENASLKVSNELKQQHKKKTRQRRKDKYSWGLKWLPLEWTNKLQHSIWWAEPGELITLDIDPVLPLSDYVPEQIWVLTNGYCYSACSFFVASINKTRLGKTLGEKAGSFADYQFAYPVSFSLPHSQLQVTIPTMKINFPFSELSNSVEPQQIIIRTQHDIELKRDPIMIQALKEIQLPAGSID